MKEPLRSVRLHVEQHHIDNAEVKNSHHCMIADALRDAYPEAKFISVDLQSIRFSLFDENRYREERVGVRYFYFTPTLAQVALLKFDQGKKLKPFEFTMRSGITKLIRWSKKKDKVKRSHARKGTAKHRVIKKEREFGIRMFVDTKIQDDKSPRLVKKDGNIVKANMSRAV
jgi:hypothetical protein